MHATVRTSLQFPFACLLAVIMGMASLGASAAEIEVTLSGDQEVPSVTTTASGKAKFTMEDDMSLSGSVKTEGIKRIAVHKDGEIRGQLK